ncbi:1-phosphofructokinase [Vreelandella malpeensis]|uniref:Phosphofructokinase n=1 Tax=Vreelandella malpeensis TaxID=1172368 RepID=A0ABS8DVD1_9GAMM|nr:1-phosphofructokinase [Halomonas malpeensis]MCB8890185.1 1-phosphofructokinase [Halomonas malpeensis]
MARVMTVTLNPALDLAFALDELAPGAVNRSHHAELQAAGKGVNVARVLAGLGHEVIVGGFLGADNDAPFKRAFAQMGVTDAFLRLPGDTRINAKLAERSGRVTDINGPGIAVEAAAMQALIEIVEATLATHEVAALLVAGSLPPGLDVEGFGEFLARLKATGVPLWVDTSGAALTRAIAVAPQAVKPNELELADWAGNALENLEARLAATARLHAAGIEQSLLSAGADGVLWVNARGAWQARPPRLQAANTVGAGDTFVAGMLHGLLSGHDDERTLRFATALSAESVRHVGVGDHQASDFSTLLQQTQVARLYVESPDGALS